MPVQPPTPPVPPVKPTTPPAEKVKGRDKKWLMWGLIGFTVILLVTAVVLFIQLNKPAVPAVPDSKSSFVPKPLPVQEVSTEGVCEVSFTIEELECEEVTITPSGTSVVAEEERELEAQVSGGSGTYTHEWTIETDGDDEGTLSSTTTNPTDWTAPADLDEEQSWTIKDTITDTSTDPQTVECEVTLNFTGLIACFDDCTEDADCESGLRCMTVGGEKRCVNPECIEDADCVCASPVPSPTPSPGASPVPSPTPSPTPPTVPGASPTPPVLPEAGVNTPLVLGVSAGILMMILGLLF